MTHLKVVSKTLDILKLSKRPGIRSWSFFFGILSLGIGAAYYGSDPLLLKCGYVIGCLLIGLSLLEDSEDCIFDKNIGSVSLSRTSIWHLLIGRVSSQTEFPLQRILQVREKKRPGSRCEFDVELMLSTGVAVALAEKDCFSTLSDCQLIASTVRRFLKLERIEQLDECNDDSSCFNSAENSSTSEQSDSDEEESDNASGLQSAACWTPREQVLAVNIAT